MERIKQDYYRLSTGREFYANNGIIGLEPKKDGVFKVTEGYDGGVNLDEYPWSNPPIPAWTATERAELAGYMIEQWAKFADIHIDFGPSWARPVGVSS